MDLPPIRAGTKKLSDYIHLTWYFDTFRDKAVLVIIGTLGLWKALELLLKLIK